MKNLSNQTPDLQFHNISTTLRLVPICAPVDSFLLTELLRVLKLSRSPVYPFSPLKSQPLSASTHIAAIMSTIVEVTTHTHFPIKLTAHNFPVWRKQVLATLTGLGLDGYVTGSVVAPSKVLSTDNTKSNLAYLPWFRQDQIILGALLGSCSETIQPIVSSAETAHEAFKRSTASYASVSRSRIISLKSRLANNPKGTRSITDFLLDMKNIADDLALAQSPVDEEDLIVHILGQLGEEYNHISSALKIRDTPITFPDLFDKLLDHERTLKDTQTPPAIATVNNTQKHSNRYPPRANYDNRTSNRFNNNNRSSRSPGQHNGSNNYQRGNRNTTYCRYCNIIGHETKECRKLARFLKENNITISMNPSANPMVNTTSANSTSSPPWMFDSGASHHVASNPASFHTLSEYGGPDEIVLGNGKSLSISHTGHSTLPTSSRPLHLHNVLFVPQLRNNLIFVAKLCKSNNVSVEFFPYFFLVKDLHTGTILMRGLPRLNSTVISNLSIISWHHKLGHQSTKVFNFLLSHLGLPCNEYQLHKLPFGANSFKATKPLELVYSDVWGPVQTSNDGYAYYVIFVDFYSRYIWLYPMKHKSDVSILFPQFRTLVEKYYNTPLVSLFTDNGGEFIKLTTYLQQHGISHFTTPPHTPEQNGIAERRHRHIVETGLSLLHHANLPLTFWTHAFQTAVHLINRLPTPILDFKSPYEKLHTTPPIYQKLKPFGCLCYPWLQPYSPSKIHPRSTKCIFLGYSSSKSAYKCYDPTSHRLYHSRHVELIEHIYPYQTDNPTSLPTADDFCPTTPKFTDSMILYITPFPLIQPPHQYILSLLPIAHTTAFCSFFLTSSANQKTAMDSEFNALIQNQTWDLVPPYSHTPIGCKWVFRIKRNPDGSISKYKARLVAKGFLQQRGKDYFDTFSPVTKPVTIRTIISIALAHNWPLRQLDVNNVFLHGTLHEDVFMSQPPGFIHHQYPDHICKLKKSIYGLKQASRAWYLELTSFLLNFGFTKSLADASLFICKNQRVTCYFMVYVDDIVLTGNDSKFIDSFISALSNKFSLKDLGMLHHFLGVEVIPTPTGLFLSQHRHIQDILNQCHMEGAKDVTTPLSATEPLSLNDQSPPIDATPYRKLVGSLQYLAFTRPDISLAVNKLSQFMHTPRQTHWQSLKRVLRYLKGTIHHGLFLKRNSSLTLSVFSDSDWGGVHSAGRSTTAYLLYLGTNIVSWKSTRQKSVSRSSTEVEYKALANASAELIWLKNLLHELGIPTPATPSLFCDNTGATYLCANPVYHS
ncbi:hypothetical protein LXL04_012102 [Taraxacum kok-saghyz]